MPERGPIERAKRDKKAGKPPSSQAGEFVREEMHKYKRGEGAGSPRQAVAIGLSRARRAGVDLPPPKHRGHEVKKRAERDLKTGKERGEL